MSRSARDSVLAAGLDLLHGVGVRAGVSHIRLEHAARRAGYTTGAAYRCWPSQDEFHRELALAAMAWRDRSSNADVINSIRAAVDGGAPIDEVVRLGAAANVERTPEETDYFVPLVLRASARFDDELADAARARVDEGIAAHEQLHEVLMSRYHRRVRAPLTLRDFSTIVAAVADGFAVQDVGRAHPRVEVEPARPGVGREWTLLGIAVWALVDQLTEPVPDGPAASVAGGERHREVFGAEDADGVRLPGDVAVEGEVGHPAGE
jgi:AcrR family transcriptional regulator